MFKNKANNGVLRLDIQNQYAIICPFRALTSRLSKGHIA